MNLDETIQTIDEAITRYGVAKKTLETMKTADLPEGVRVSWCGANVLLEVVNTEGLHDARTFLRKVFGSWNDNVANIVSSWGEYATATYRNEENNKVQIRFDFKIDNIPEGLRSDTCKFVETTEKSYNYVCSKGA